eukprot:364557-Chlamydomonas_euryale.AAC.46
MAPAPSVQSELQRSRTVHSAWRTDMQNTRTQAMRRPHSAWRTDMQNTRTQAMRRPHLRGARHRPLLDDLLVAALDAAITALQRRDVAVHVAKKLHLQVAAAKRSSAQT